MATMRRTCGRWLLSCHSHTIVTENGPVRQHARCLLQPAATKPVTVHKVINASVRLASYCTDSSSYQKSPVVSNAIMTTQPSPNVPLSVINGVCMNLSAPPEYLYRSLRRMQPADILATLEACQGQLDRHALPIALRRLHTAGSYLSADANLQYIHDVQHTVGFQYLTVSLARKCRYLSADAATDAIHFLSSFNMDSDHPTMRLLLQLAKFHINDISIDRLAMLSRTLSHLSQTPATQVLLKAIGLLFSARQPDPSDAPPHHRVALLTSLWSHLAADYRRQVLCSLEHDMRGVHLSNSVALLACLARDTDCASDSLQSHFLHRIVMRLDELSDDDLDTLINSCLTLRLYSPHLLHVAADNAICRPDRLIPMTSILGVTAYYHRPLVEALASMQPKLDECATWLSLLAEQGGRRPTDGTAGDVGVCDEDVTVVTAGMTINILDVVDRLRQPDDIAVQFDLAVRLAALEHSTEWTAHLLQEQQLNQLVMTLANHTDSTHIGFDNSLILIAMAALRKGYTSTSYLHHVKNAVEQITPRRSSVGKALQVALQSNHVIHAARTKSGLYVDHMIHLDEHRAVVPCNMTSPPPWGATVAMLVLDGRCFYRNTGQLKGIPHFYATSVKHEGFQVAVLDSASFFRLCETDRLRFLAHKVHSAATCQDLDMLGSDSVPATLSDVTDSCEVLEGNWDWKDEELSWQ